jgi:hypothetical protein
MTDKRNSASMTPFTFDPRDPRKRGKRQQPPRPGFVGQNRTGTPHGGGGPENFGAATTMQAGVSFFQTQPSWRWEFENDFVGAAAPSTKLDLSGYPSNNFRGNGDLYGGRQ